MSFGTAFSADAFELKIGCDAFPPHTLEPGDPRGNGYDIDNIKAVFAGSEITPVFEFYPWKRALKLVETGQLDGLCVCSKTAERETWLTYPNILGETKAGIFTPQSSETEEIKSLSTLKDKRVGVVRGYHLADILAEAGVEPITVLSEYEGMRMLAGSRIDAFYGHWSVGTFYMTEENVPQPLEFQPINVSPYYMCIRSAHPRVEMIKQVFNLGLAAIYESGAYDNNINGYFDQLE